MLQNKYGHLYVVSSRNHGIWLMLNSVSTIQALLGVVDSLLLTL